MAANLEEGRLARAALEERSVSGDLRRAIYHCDHDRDELARLADITPDMLNDFTGGCATLDSRVFDALASALGLELAAARE